MLLPIVLWGRSTKAVNIIDGIVNFGPNTYCQKNNLLSRLTQIKL